MNRIKQARVLALAVLAVAMVGCWIVLSHATAARTDTVGTPVPPLRTRVLVPQPARVKADKADAFVLRFDPALQSFETFTVPTRGARPQDVVALADGDRVDVWFTEPGVGQIGRLVYTSTGEFARSEYAVPNGGRPLELTVDAHQNLLWFTDPAANRIGRCEIGAGEMVTFTTFEVTTPDSQPSGIDLAPDGSVWFTERAADRIGHLVVTSTTDYRLDEYPVPQFPLMGERSAPYGIYAETNDKIWFVETARHQLVRLTPSISEFINTGALEGAGYPYHLIGVPADRRIWFTEREGNHITLFSLSTLAIGLQYDVPTPNSVPYDLAADSQGRVWFTEQFGHRLGSLMVTTVSMFEEYPLPWDSFQPKGITVDPHDKVWVVGAGGRDEQWPHVYLPFALNDFPLDPPLFGVQTYWSVDSANGLPEMASADVAWLRLTLSWRAVEPADTTPEGYRWDKYDQWFSNLQAHNIRPVVTVQGNPDWAAQYGGGPLYPEHMPDMVEFVGAMVERYDGDGFEDAPGSPVVNHWEFYNEQDNANVLLAEAGYGYWGHNGAAYADLLRQLGPVIKGANPRAQVLNGGIAYERFEETGDGPYVRQFLDDFLAAGGGEYIDIFNFHYYPDFAYVWAPYGSGVIGKANYLRDKLSSYGVSKPMACTEIGTHSDPSRGGSDELQSRYVVQSFVRAMAADLEIVNWFALRDITEGFPYLYGLLDTNYAPKPAFTAFKVLTSQLTNVRYDRTLTVEETGTAEIEGYVFVRDAQRVYVVWTNDDAQHTLDIAASEVERVDKYGVTDVLLDRADGVMDGVITVEIGPSPLFLAFEP